MIDALARQELTRSQTVWGLTALLLPASICTLLVWAFLPGWWQLSAYFWYSIPGNSFILLPHEPAVIYAGTLYSPLLVAIVGGWPPSRPPRSTTGCSAWRSSSSPWRRSGRHAFRG